MSFPLLRHGWLQARLRDRSADRPAVRERVVAIGLTVLIHVILLFLLLWVKPDLIPFRRDDSALATFDLPSPKAGQQQAARAVNQQEKTAQASQTEREPREKPPDPAVKKTENPVPPPQVEAPSMIAMSAADFAASDIGKIKRSAGTAKGTGKDASNVYGPGEGPGGAQLFNAEWYREPTSVELGGYLPKDMPRNGYGLIACRTVEDYRVEGCRVLEERPLGSGLAQAVRRAAWQFRVVPPRVNGKPQLGAWVRIRIDYRNGVQQIH